MKSTVAAVAVLALSLACIGTARAETAIGAVFGYPGNVGLSMRFDRTPIGVAWSDNFIHGTIDMWIKKTPMKDTEGKMSFYYGPGADVGIPTDSANDWQLAFRVPFGLQYMASPKMELFGELAPGIKIINDVDFYWAGSVGIRFVLGK